MDIAVKTRYFCAVTKTGLTTKDVNAWPITLSPLRPDNNNIEETKENITNDANGHTGEEAYKPQSANPETGPTTKYNDDKIAAKNHLTPSPPLGGKSQAAEGGANLQVELYNHMESTNNNPCLACNRNETNKATEPIAKKEATTDLAFISIRTNMTPNLTEA